MEQKELLRPKYIITSTPEVCYRTHARSLLSHPRPKYVIAPTPEVCYRTHARSMLSHPRPKYIHSIKYSKTLIQLI